MKKVELLSPAGDFSSLKQAIHNGADAIYLGGKNFGARAFANNFSNEELEYAIKYAHLYDVKIYVTVNTLIYEEETNDFFKYIDFLVSIKVDALITQDLGMIKTVKEMYPDITIHASTQFHNYNNDTLEVLKDLGVKRVVLARELSIDEINNMSCNIEKEVFIHGALCVSYSGECLFSSLVANRSGNRGECAGSCRLPYDLMKDDEILKLKDKYLLSTRELNTTLNIKELLDSNITSLKIEGRMKTPAYVGFVTKTYRHLIDNYYNNLNCVISKEDTIKLTKLYNREFTNGYLFNTKELMNINTPNHLGIKLGEVLDINSKYIKIKLIDELHQGDGIRFFNTDIGMITNFIY
ncbi:MAG: peptidase U32 family protein [Bacilli bacterium]